MECTCGIEPRGATLHGHKPGCPVGERLARHHDPIESQSDFRKYPPISADSPLVGIECIACHQEFKIGDRVTLVVIGPGADKKAQQRAREGRPYTAVARAVHYACATGEPDGD